MNIKAILFLLFTVTVATSCSRCNPSISSDSDGILSITIDATEDKISYPLSEITENVKVIELETNDLSFIKGEIRRVHIMKEQLIICDESFSFLVFDFNGNFVRRVGKQGQGPGEFNTRMILLQVDSANNTIWCWLFHKLVIYDINGNLVKDKVRDRLTSFYEYYYHSNDSIFIIQENLEKMNDSEYKRDISFIICAHSNGNYSTNLLDSLFIRKFEPTPPTVPCIMKTIFQHQGQVYLFFSVCYDDEYDYLYVIKNNQFMPIAKFSLKSIMRDLAVTDRYLVAIHGNLIRDNVQAPNIITPEIMRALRNSQQVAERDFSYYVHDYKTGKQFNSYHGFIDDIHHTNEIIPIKFIDGGEKFFYVREGKWSDKINAELNPTLYIGTFKK